MCIKYGVYIFILIFILILIFFFFFTNILSYISRSTLIDKTGKITLFSKLSQPVDYFRNAKVILHAS